MIVGDLLVDPRRKASVRIILDGRAAWTVPADVVAELGLAVGQPLPSGAIARLDAAADEEAAFRAGLRAIERRGHARQELARKLGHKGHPEEAVVGAIDRLARLGVLDDRAFAQAWVTARLARGRGPARLRRDLAALGVEPAIIAEVLAGAARDEAAPDPLERTLAQARRRLAGMQGLPRQAQRRRLLAFFARRGWAGDEARRHVGALLAD